MYVSGGKREDNIQCNEKNRLESNFEGTLGRKKEFMLIFQRAIKIFYYYYFNLGNRRGNVSLGGSLISSSNN